MRLAAVLTVGVVVFAAGAAGAADAPAPRHGIAMHGEPAYGPDFEHFAYVNPDAPQGGTLRRGATGTFDTVNPYTVKGQAARGADLPFATLMVKSADEPFSEYGYLAETIRVPEDRSWVEFTLRADARFHDGEPVTASDVVFSLRTLKAKGHPFYRMYYKNVEKVKALDERTVRFTFTEGTNRELPLIVGQMPVLPEHAFRDRDFKKTTLEPIPGAGPYRIKKLEQGRYIVYEKVDDWWGADLPVTRGRFNFGTLRWDYYRDSTVALEAFKAHEYDLRRENQAKKWATAYDTAAAEAGRLVTAEIPHKRPTGMQGFVFNLRRPMFRDRRVRRALTHAFNFAWTNETLFHGQYTRTESYFSNSDLAARGLPDGRELEILKQYKGDLPPAVFNERFDPPEGDADGHDREDLRQALKLLKEAGYAFRDGALVNKETGAPFSFDILLNAAAGAAWERITLPFVKNLKRLGIDAEVRTVEASQYANRVDNFEFDMIVQVFPQSRSPGNEQRSFWHSKAARTKGSRNVAGIRSDVVDDLVSRVITAESRAGLVAASRALDRVLLWGYYVIPHWHITYDRIAYWNKFGRPDDPPEAGAQILNWWVKADKRDG